MSRPLWADLRDERMASPEAQEGYAAAKVLEERERVRPELARMPGLTVYPSAANFLLVRVAGAQRSAQGALNAGTRVFESLKAQGVLVKDFSGGHPLMENCLRLTIGTPEENRILLAALREALK